MNRTVNRRPRLLYRLLKVIAVLLSCLIPGLLLGWKPALYLNHQVSIAAVILIYLGADLTLTRLLYFPGYQTKIYIFPTVCLWAAIWLIVIMYLRLPYSRAFVFLGILCALIFLVIDFTLNVQRQKRYAYIALDGHYDYRQLNLKRIKALQNPYLPKKTDFDYLLVDLSSERLTAPWLKFIAACSLRGITVIDAGHFFESYSGRVSLQHLAENELGTLSPSVIYAPLKRLLDIAVVLSIFPVFLCLVLVVTVIIRLESKGPALFTQKRVGQGGREFKIYKFRSMYRDSEHRGAKFAAAKDERITPFGKIIRKFRIDELPQFFNILKGDMSLIGPRPEQQAFVTQFEREIPFYGYRHMVKPGISGWAQVNQGYAAGTAETHIKTEYDFFYIKYFSFSLDLLIFLKTVKTVLTGFGAR